MLANIWLMQNDQPIVAWPEKSIGGASVIREEYLVAIRQADKEDYESLIAMHQKYQDE